LSHVKGLLLSNLRSYVEKTRGPAAWGELVARVGPADREVLGGLVLAAGWYPVGAWNRVVELHFAGATRTAELQALARHVADKDFSLVFKTLLKMGTVEFILERADSLWHRYFDVGQLHVVDRAPRRWRIELEAPVRVDEGAGEATCNVGVCSWMTHALAIAGSKVHITHPRCRFHASERCMYLVTW
jgi:hypothetical protein